MGGNSGAATDGGGVRGKSFMEKLAFELCFKGLVGLCHWRYLLEGKPFLLQT